LEMEFSDHDLKKLSAGKTFSIQCYECDQLLNSA